MAKSWRLLAVLLGCALVVACQPSQPAPSPSASSSAPSSTNPASTKRTATPNPSINPATPELARSIVDDLTRKVNDAAIVRVQIDDRHVSLTYVDKTNRPVSLIWQDGAVSVVDEGTDFVVSASFDPRVFAVEKITEMFEIAALIAGSDSRQQLQITEYSDGKILLSVTTNPETTTVFFRHDGSPIWPLNYRTADGIASGLADATVGLTWVLGISISEDQLWVDAPGQEPGTTERMMRPAGLPAFKTVRNQAIDDVRFAHDRVDPVIVAQLLTQLPAELGKPGATASVLIQQQQNQKEPRMIFDVAGTKVVTDLAGKRLAPGR